MFATLSVDELTDLLRAVSPRTVKSSEIVFSQTDAGDAAYVIEYGQIKIRARATAKGPEVEVATLGPGEVFGELALIDGAPRSATAIADGPAQLFRIDRAEFDFLRRNLRPAAFKVIRSISLQLSDRLRDTNDHIVRLIAGGPEPGEDEAPTKSGFFRKLIAKVRG